MYMSEQEIVRRMMLVAHAYNDQQRARLEAEAKLYARRKIEAANERKANATGHKENGI